MERISRATLALGIADLISKRGTCRRARVGCVITTSDHRIISSGYNGPLKEEDCIACDIEKGCKLAIHAEANAIAAAAKWGIRLNCTILYSTVAPCIKCAELIIQSGILIVNFSIPYRDEDGIKLLQDHGVEVYQL